MTQTNGSEPEVLLTVEELKDKILIEGEDYGQVQGIPKPALLLPGAQKIAKYYGYAPTFVIQESVEQHADQFYFYRTKCVLTDNNGVVVGDMIGSFSSHDAKTKAKAQANTILKMAEKRAFVSAVLYVTASSGVFSADVDDMPPEQLSGVSMGNSALATTKQINMLNRLAQDRKIPYDEASEAHEKMTNDSLTKSEASKLIDSWLKCPKNTEPEIQIDEDLPFDEKGNLRDVG